MVYRMDEFFEVGDNFGELGIALVVCLFDNHKERLRWQVSFDKRIDFGGSTRLRLFHNCEL